MAMTPEIRALAEEAGIPLPVEMLNMDERESVQFLFVMAERVLRQSVELARLIADRAIVAADRLGDPLVQARARAISGRVAARSGDNETARTDYQEALRLRQGTDEMRGQPRDLLSLAQLALETGQCDQTADHARRAEQRFRLARDRRGQADSLTVLGQLAWGEPRVDEAEQHFQEALRLYQAEDYEPGMANCEFYLGEIASFSKRNAEARGHYGRALSAYGGIQDRLGQGNCHRSLGDLDLLEGCMREARDHYSQALLLYRDLGYGLGEANCCACLGRLASQEGRCGEARERFRSAHEIYTTLGDARGQALTCSSLGELAFREDRYREARDFYNQALALYRRLGDRDGEGNSLAALAQALFHEAQSPEAQSEGHRVRPDLWAEAKQHCRQALLLFEAVKDPLGQTNCCMILGQIAFQEALHLRMQGCDARAGASLREAQEYHEQALPLYEEMAHPTGSAHCYFFFGRVAFLAREFACALRWYSEARSLYSAAGSRWGLAAVLRDMGRLEEERGQPAEALEFYREAIALAEHIREEAGDEVARMGIFPQLISVYERAIALVLQDEGPTPEVFELCEKLRGRALLDRLQVTRVRQLRDLSPEEREEWQQLRQRAARIREALLDAQADPNSSAERLAQLRRELDDAREALEQYERTLYQQYPALNAIRGGQTATWQDLAGLLDEQTALLEYLVTEDVTRVFIMWREDGEVRLRHVERRVGLGELREQIELVLRQCYDEQGDVPDYRMEIRDLYDLLLKPALAELGRMAPVEGTQEQRPHWRRLIICPDGPLYNLPFQALLRSEFREDHYVLEDYEIVYSYSASILKECMRLKRERAGTWPGELIVFADPDYGEPAGAPDEQDRRRHASLVPLPGTAEAAQALKDLYGDRGKVYEGALAQESRVQAEAGRWRYWHIAAHGLLDMDRPLFSAIALAPPPQGDPEDGFLEARELAETNLEAEMLTLPNCHTAQGRVRAGEGLVGFLWASFAAGVPTTLVSQWRAHDEATARLMTHFYRRVHCGMPEAQSLREAQLVLRFSEEHCHPSYWGPIILAGDGGDSVPSRQGCR